MASQNQHRRPYERSAAQPNNYLSTLTANDTNTSPAETHTLRLIWHICHLCNVTTSSISVYLSLEALARESCAHGTLEGSHVAYQPAMRAQALMLTDIVQNLENDRDTLLRTNLHTSYLQYGSYRSLIDAANVIPAIVRSIPQTISPFLDAAKLNEVCMPNKQVVDEIRRACDEATGLCAGNASKGITGWRECWNVVGQQIGQQ